MLQDSRVWLEILMYYFFRYNIRCNAILPGFIETPMVATVPDKVKDKLKQLIPFGRMGTPEGPQFLDPILSL